MTREHPQVIYDPVGEERKRLSAQWDRIWKEIEKLKDELFEQDEREQAIRKREESVKHNNTRDIVLAKKLRELVRQERRQTFNGTSNRILALNAELGRISDKLHTLDVLNHKMKNASPNLDDQNN